MDGTDSGFVCDSVGCVRGDAGLDVSFFFLGGVLLLILLEWAFWANRGGLVDLSGCCELISKNEGATAAEDDIAMRPAA